MSTDWTGRRVAVAGLGRAGVAAATALLDLGCDVVVVDEALDARHDAVSARLEAAGARVRRGVHEVPPEVDLVVTSPGLRHGHPMLAAAVDRGTEVIGEPDLAWRLRPHPTAPWLGITGTNGKTTTVGMVESILLAAGHRAVAAGNVGLPLVEAVRTDPPYDVVAVEMSSAQLSQSTDVRFAVAAILNIAPDHLDWHGDFADYRASKLRIWREAVAVGNVDDPEVAGALPPDGIPVGRSVRPPGFGLIDGVLQDGDGSALVAASELAVAGPHYETDALVAAAVCRVWGVPPEAVRAGLTGFRAGAHRASVVATGAGVAWIDDSKATNPHAAAAGLAAHRSIVWIAGGMLKGADVDGLVAEVAPRLRGTVLIGRDRAAFAASLARHAPGIPVVALTGTDTEVMHAAVEHAASMAQPGDAVVLAPAAASWDIFRDYAERGDLFAAAARAAAGRQAGEPR